MSAKGFIMLGVAKEEIMVKNEGEKLKEQLEKAIATHKSENETQIITKKLKQNEIKAKALRSMMESVLTMYDSWTEDSEEVAQKHGNVAGGGVHDHSYLQQTAKHEDLEGDCDTENVDVSEDSTYKDNNVGHRGKNNEFNV
ncbi:hypothetical protein I4U23_021732 [Adineta vaga]|nr:hypothetical protein I4U23_021732 [Adineta vaga]